METKKLLDAVLEEISKGLERGEEIQFAGFGSFRLRDRSARMGRNPTTGEPMAISASKVVNFKVGNVLRNRVNK